MMRETPLTIRLGRAVAAVSLAACLTLVNAGFAEAAPDENSPIRSELTRLEAALSAHPDDPDLHWAYAKKLAKADQQRESVIQTQSFLERWPDRRPGARTEIARILLENGAHAEAAHLLDQEIAHNPRLATSRFYRGLAYRSEGHVQNANREFVIAARLQPSLRAESMLAQALGYFDLGDDEAAVSMLQEILRLDPSGDTAIRARLLLRNREALVLQKRWVVDGYLGFQWDENVTLENSESEVNPSGTDDVRGSWGIGGTWQAVRNEHSTITVGYRYDQTDYNDINRLNLISNTAFVSGSWQPTERLALQINSLISHLLLDGSNEYTGASLRPSLVYSMGEDWGAIRLFSQFGVAEYHEKPSRFRDRDALSYGLGVEHFLPLRIDRSWLSFSGSWDRTVTQEDPDEFGSADLDGDFDYDSWRARGVATLGLPFAIRGQVETSYAYDRYHNNNSTHFFTASSGLRKRRDDIISGRVALSRAIVKHVRGEVYWRGTRRISNVDLFDYDKHVAGILVRVSTD